MPVSINGTNGLVFPDGSTQGTASPGRNRIINGAMMIDQRNAGASVTPTSNVTYTLDRWVMLLNQSSKFSVQQQTSVVPTGFTHAMAFTSLSAYSVGAGEVFGFRQSIEGFNFADCNWGTANAATVTLSFWVRSSLTGMFGGAIKNSDETRVYPFSYSISAANTWEKKTLTIAGDTTGTWVGATNGAGVSIVFSLGVGTNLSGTAGAWANGNLFSTTGANSVVGTNGATFYITGVQLEVGSTATSFDTRPYTTELQLCQRYCYAQGWPQGGATYSYAVFGTLYADTANIAYGTTIFPVTMRTKPSVTSSISNTFYGSFFTPDSNPTNIDQASIYAGILGISCTGGTAGKAGRYMVNNTATCYAIWSAEL